MRSSLAIKLRWTVVAAVVAVFGAVGVITLAAPVPGGNRKPTAAVLKAVLGRPPASDEVKALVHSFDRKPTVDYVYWRGASKASDFFYLQWPQDGLELYVQDNTVSAAWVYNNGVEGHERYSGELPEGLTFDDDLAVVAKKLGDPDKEPKVFEKELTKNEVIEMTWADYKQGRVQVEFQRPAGGKLRLTRIMLNHPDDHKK